MEDVTEKRLKTANKSGIDPTDLLKMINEVTK